MYKQLTAYKAATDGGDASTPLTVVDDESASSFSAESKMPQPRQAERRQPSPSFNISGGGDEAQQLLLASVLASNGMSFLMGGAGFDDVCDVVGKYVFIPGTCSSNRVESAGWNERNGTVPCVHQEMLAWCVSPCWLACLGVIDFDDPPDWQILVDEIPERKRRGSLARVGLGW
jgi:hypothetical protein